MMRRKIGHDWVDLVEKELSLGGRSCLAYIVKNKHDKNVEVTSDDNFLLKSATAFNLGVRKC